MELRDRIAHALMQAHGYSKEEPISKLEWDPERPDSAYSMMLEDADIAVGAIMGATENEEPEALTGVVSPASSSVSQTAGIFIFLNSEPGTPLYVKDVRDWLDAVSQTNIPDHTEVEGSLYLSYDIEATSIEDNGTDIILRNSRSR
jgi:hypothetical protein